MLLPGVQVGQAINRSHPLARGLLTLHYALPENQGSSLLSDLNRRSQGVLNNSPTWKGGKIEYVAASSTSVTGTITNTSVQANNEFTLFAAATDTLGEDASTTRTLIEITPGASLARLNYHDRVGFPPSLYMNVRWGFGGPSVGTSIALPVGVPQYICGTFRSGDQSLYVNSRSVASATTSYTLPVDMTDWKIGYGWTGFIPVVAIWNRCLSSGEVAELTREARSAFPSLLNYRRVFWDVPQSPPFKPSFAAQSNGLLTYA